MKYSEAKQQIEALSDGLRTNIGTNEDFNVFYKDELMFWVSKKECDITTAPCANINEFQYYKKLYMILVDLAITAYEDRKENKKYFIRVFKTENGYLNVHYNGKAICDDSYEVLGFKTKFTSDEINQLKQRQDVPLDWSKIELEPVN